MTTKYRHNPVTDLVERVKPINTVGITNPSSTQVVRKVAFPFDPLSAEGQLVLTADAETDFYYGEALGDTQSELTNGEYADLQKQDGSVVSVTGIKNQFISGAGTTLERIHDVKSDDTHAYVLWSNLEGGVYKLNVTKLNPDGTIASSAVCTSDTATNFFNERATDYARSQNRTARLAVPENPHANFYVMLCINGESTATPGFAGGGSDNGITLYRFVKATLAAAGGTDAWDVVPSDVSHTFKEASIELDDSNELKIAYIKKEIGGSLRDVIGYAQFNYSTSSLTAGADIKTLTVSDLAAHVKPIKVGALATRVWWSEYDDSLGTVEIRAADSNGANEDVIASQGSTGMTDGMPFDVVGSVLNNNFHCFYFAEDNAGSDTIVYAKVCASDGTGGGTKFVRGTPGIETGNIYAIFTAQATQFDGYAVWGVHDVVENAEFCMFENLALTASIADTLEYRKPTVTTPASRVFFPCYFAPRGCGIIGAATTGAGSGEVFVSLPSYPAIMFKMDGGNQWHREASKLYLTAMGGAGLEFGIHLTDNIPGIRLMLFNSTWIKPFDSRGESRSTLNQMYEGMGVAAETLGPLFSSANPDILYALVVGNSRGDLYDPAKLDLSSLFLSIDPEEENIVGTTAIAPAAVPHSIVTQLSLGRYNEEASYPELSVSLYAPSSQRYAVFGDSVTLLSFLDVNNDISSSISVELDGMRVVSVTGVAVDPTTGIVYCSVETDKFGSTESLLISINTNSGYTTIIGSLGDKFSDIVFKTDGSLFGITHETASVAESLYEIDKYSAAATLRASLGSGTGHVLGYNPGDGLFYHVYDTVTKMQSVLAQAPWTITGIALSQPNSPPDNAIVSPTSIVWDGSAFLVQSDPVGKDTFSLTTAGLVTWIAATTGSYYSMADIPVTMPELPITGSGGVDSVAMPFYTSSQEAVYVDRVDLELSKSGSPVDEYDVKIVKYHSSQNGYDVPVMEEVMSEGVLDAAAVSAGVSAITVEMRTVLKPLLPGVAYAVVLSRKYSPHSLWTISEVPFYLHKTAHLTGDSISTIELSIPGETITQLDGVAVDPTTGILYVSGASDADPTHSFLGTVDKETGIVSKIGVSPNHMYNDISFSAAGQLYGVTWRTSPSHSNYAGTIDKGTGAMTPVIAVGGSTLQRSCCFNDSDGLLYHVHGDTLMEKINMGVPSLVNIPTSGDVPTVGAQALGLIRDENLGAFIAYFDDERIILSYTGVFLDYSKTGEIQYLATGAAFDIDGTTPITDAVNCLNWHRGAEPFDLSGAYSARVRLIQWAPSPFYFACSVYAKHYNDVVIEASRDNGVTWTVVPQSVLMRVVESAWNSHNLERQEIGGNVSLESQPSGSSVRIRARLKGCFQEIRSISYFPK